MPRFVMIELTQGCNLSCPMCRSERLGVRGRSMDATVLAEAGELLFPYAEVVDIRGWGESLIVADVAATIEAVALHGARCRVVTNLSFRRDDVLRMLAAEDAMLDVSLDSPYQATLDHCRRGAKMGVIDANLRNLVAWSISEASNIRILATVQRRNLSDLADLVRYAADVGVATVVLNEVTLADGHPDGLNGLAAEVDRAVARAAEVAAEAGVRLQAGTGLGTRVPSTKSKHVCLHPWSYVTVGFDGSVGFCDHLIGPMMPLTCMGRIDREGFDEIWNGARWGSLREWHTRRRRATTQCYSACAACYRHRNVDFEHVFDSRFAPTYVVPQT